MHQAVRLTTAQKSESSPLRRQGWKQASREVHSVDRCGRKVRRRPRSHFQIECVHVARCACEQDEYHILSAVEQRNSSLNRSRLGTHVQRRDEVAGNSCACDLEKYATVDDHGFPPWINS